MKNQSCYARFHLSIDDDVFFRFFAIEQKFNFRRRPSSVSLCERLSASAPSVTRVPVVSSLAGVRPPSGAGGGARQPRLRDEGGVRRGEHHLGRRPRHRPVGGAPLRGRRRARGRTRRVRREYRPRYDDGDVKAVGLPQGQLAWPEYDGSDVRTIVCHKSD